MSRGEHRGPFAACSGLRITANDTTTPENAVNDHETPSGQRLKSPLLYQLSYRDESLTSIEDSAAAAPTETVGVGGDVGVIEQARRLLNYNPETGALTWKVSRRKARAGDIAGTQTPEGYTLVGVMGRTYMAHRLAWMLHTGEMPPARVDHVNGQRSDNRWANLRAASDHENAWNSLRSANATGVWRRYGRIHGRIRHLGKVYTAGPFETEAECTAWYREKERELRGMWSATQRQVAA